MRTHAIRRSRNESWTAHRACGLRARGRRSRAERDRVDLLEDLVWFFGVVALLLWMVRPIGVIVALVWGAKLLHRYADTELFPRLRKRFVEEELARRGVGRASRDGDEDLAEEAVVERVGDDPRSRENLRRARVALESIRALEREERTRRSVELSDLVDGALAGLGPRLRSRSVEVEREIEPQTTVVGDPVVLERVVGQLLSSAVDVLEQSAVRPARISVRGGENLARTEAWLRIGHSGPAADPASLRESVRPFYVPEEDLPEFRLVLEKRPETAAQDHR
jgi:signal transduction histidine kinase